MANFSLKGKERRDEFYKLELMFDRQAAFQKRLRVRPGTAGFRRVQVLAAMVELAEFIQETPWKPWRKKQKMNAVKAKEELVDAMHFLINLALGMKMTPQEFYALFMQKNAVNNARQDQGY